MSVNATMNFQSCLYHILSSDKRISNKVKAIYFSLPNNAKLPHILVHNFQSKIEYAHERQNTHMSFNIDIFFREQHRINIAKLTEILQEIIRRKNFIDAGFSLITISNDSIHWGQGNDLVTHKISLAYSFLR